MPGPPSPQSHPQEPRQSIRWDAAQRACRDNHLQTLQFLITQGGLFENATVLREACESGAWGTGKNAFKIPFSTTDSIRLHTLLQTATTRGHIPIVRYLLAQFPAKDLHVLEWEITINAIAQGSVELLEPFVAVDPGFVNMCDERYGTCFTVLFDLVPEKEKHLSVVRFFCDRGADISALPDVLRDCARSSTAEVMQYLLERSEPSSGGGELLCEAAYHGNDDIVAYFLDRGEYVNLTARIEVAKNDISESRTPLFYAIAGGHAPTIKSLLNKGAALTQQDLAFVESQGNVAIA